VNQPFTLYACSDDGAVINLRQYGLHIGIMQRPRPEPWAYKACAGSIFSGSGYLLQWIHHHYQIEACPGLQQITAKYALTRIHILMYLTRCVMASGITHDSSVSDMIGYGILIMQTAFFFLAWRKGRPSFVHDAA
jgi:hypothetical protein